MKGWVWLMSSYSPPRLWKGCHFCFWGWAQKACYSVLGGWLDPADVQNKKASGIMGGRARWAGRREGMVRSVYPGCGLLMWGTQGGRISVSFPCSILERDGLLGCPFTRPGAATSGKPVGCSWWDPGRPVSETLLGTSWVTWGVSGTCPRRGFWNWIENLWAWHCMRVRRPEGGSLVPRRRWQTEGSLETSLGELSQPGSTPGPAWGERETETETERD